MAKTRHRRLLAVALMAIGLLTTQTAVAAGKSATRHVADEFATASYAGSDGTHPWNGPWVEVVEADGPSAGVVRVREHLACSDGSCLVIGGRDAAITGRGVVRAVDLSEAEDARLSFELGVVVHDPERTLGSVTVAISPSNGVWHHLTTVTLDEEDDAGHDYDITAWATGTTRIGFFGAGWVSAVALIDDVEIEWDVDEQETTIVTTTTTTTTTTTSPPRPPATTTTTTTTTTRPPSRPPATTTTTTNPPTPPPTTRPPAAATTTTTTAPAVAAPPSPPTPPDGDPRPAVVLPLDDPLTERLYASRQALGLEDLDGAALSRAIQQPDKPRSPVDLVWSTVDIARDTAGDYAIHAFLLGVVVAWAALRGLGDPDDDGIADIVKE